MRPLVCVDVDYRDSSSVAAAVVFHDWTDAASSHEAVHKADSPPADYQPGQFYLRELPHLLAVLEQVTKGWTEPPRLIVVDGFVWLADEADEADEATPPAAGEGAAGEGVAGEPVAGARAAARQHGVHRTVRPGPGLGAHLHHSLAALGHPIPIIGVAKRPYRLANRAVPVLRGESAVPLWITSVGISVEEAAAAVAAMHGEHRIPTLLKRVDRLARDS